MSYSLAERQGEYESIYDFTIMRRLPIVIKATLQNNKRLTQNLEKPFSDEFADIMMQTLMYAISQIQDAVFGYYFGDEISIVLRNDMELDYEPWNGNNLQKIVSTVSCYFTNGFLKSASIFGDEVDIPGDPVFKTQVWPVPNISEAINYLISRQDSSIKNSINISCNFELEQKFGKERTSELFKNKDYEQKKEMLLRYCGIEFDDYYPTIFIYGGAVYKVPVIISDKVTKNKWFADDEIPNFIEDRDFVGAIISNGADIYRAPDIMKLKER